MKYNYTEKDLDFISWESIDRFVDKIYKDVDNFINENNLKIKYIVPILRGGAVPAVMLSHMLNVIDMLPIQLKNRNNGIDTLVNLDYVKDINISDNECILLVECNHATGKTANMAADIIRNKFGNDVKIIYVSLARDYSYRYSVKNTIFDSWAITTNETKELSIEECINNGIDNTLICLYPWENIEEELYELNK